MPAGTRSSRRAASPPAPPPAVDDLTNLERLLLAQAVFELGSDAWDGVSKILSEHPLISRPKATFLPQSCQTIYESLLSEASLESSESDTQPRRGKSNLKLAQRFYQARVNELRDLILAEEAQFKLVASEIHAIRSGEWDTKIKADLGIEVPEESTEVSIEEAVESPPPSKSPSRGAISEEAEAVPEVAEPTPVTPQAEAEDVVVPEDGAAREEAVPEDTETTPRPRQLSELSEDKVELVEDSLQEQEPITAPKSRPASASPEVITIDDEPIEISSVSASPKPIVEAPAEEHPTDAPPSVEDEAAEVEAIEGDATPKGVEIPNAPSEEPEGWAEDNENVTEEPEVEAAEPEVEEPEAAVEEAEPEAEASEPEVEVETSEPGVEVVKPETVVEVVEPEAEAAVEDVSMKDEVIDIVSSPEESVPADATEDTQTEAEATASPAADAEERRRDHKRKASELADALGDSEREKKRPRETSTPADEDEAPSPRPGPSRRRGGRPPSDMTPASKKFQSVIIMLHSQISQHRNGNIFHNPIKNSEAPDYHEIVKRPMDLKTIKMRIKDGTISNSAEFQRDVYLMFANSMMYNRPNSDIYNMAEEMMLESETQINTFRQTEGFVRGGHR